MADDDDLQQLPPVRPQDVAINPVIALVLYLCREKGRSLKTTCRAFGIVLASVLLQRTYQFWRRWRLDLDFISSTFSRIYQEEDEDDDREAPAAAAVAAVATIAADAPFSTRRNRFICFGGQRQISDPVTDESIRDILDGNPFRNDPHFSDVDDGNAAEPADLAAILDGEYLRHDEVPSYESQNDGAKRWRKRPQ